MYAFLSLIFTGIFIAFLVGLFKPSYFGRENKKQIAIIFIPLLVIGGYISSIFAPKSQKIGNKEQLSIKTEEVTVATPTEQEVANLEREQMVKKVRKRKLKN